jgi:hypothetical protein
MDTNVQRNEQPSAPGPTPAAIKAARQWLLQFEWGGQVVDLLDQPDVDTAAWFTKVDLMRRSVDGEDSAPFG